MKKLSLALALIFPTIAAMATTKPVISMDEINARDKLLDKGIIATSVVKDGDCFKFDTATIKGGKICGDKITLY